MAEQLRADDKLQILELLARYAWTIDSADAEGYASLFTKDAVLGMGDAQYHGTNEILAYASELVSRPNWPGSQHHNGQIIFDEGNPTTCKLRSYSMILFRLADGSCNFRHLGLYRDRCVKVDEQWYFAERHWERWDPDKIPEYRVSRITP
jgi:hypothetical protein